MAELTPLRCPYCRGELYVDIDTAGSVRAIECDEYVKCGATWGRDGDPCSGPREEN